MTNFSDSCRDFLPHTLTQEYSINPAKVARDSISITGKYSAKIFKSETRYMHCDDAEHGYK